jgi:hypothetical protein
VDTIPKAGGTACHDPEGRIGNHLAAFKFIAKEKAITTL